MKQIPLTKGQVALVDDSDYEWLMQWKWRAQRSHLTWYAVRTERLSTGKRVAVCMHRELLGLKRGDGLQGDHKNHNGLDNRRVNLRIVTNQDNRFNLSRARGYCWCNEQERFRAYIYAHGKQYHLGYYPTAQEARDAYMEAKSKLHKIREVSCVA